MLLVGTNHEDQQGIERLTKVLEATKPRSIGLELTTGIDLYEMLRERKIAADIIKRGVRETSRPCKKVDLFLAELDRYHYEFLVVANYALNTGANVVSIDSASTSIGNILTPEIEAASYEQGRQVGTTLNHIALRKYLAARKEHQTGVEKFYARVKRGAERTDIRTNPKQTKYEIILGQLGNDLTRDQHMAEQIALNEPDMIVVGALHLVKGAEGKKNLIDYLADQKCDFRRLILCDADDPAELQKAADYMAKQRTQTKDFQ